MGEKQAITIEFNGSSGGSCSKDELDFLKLLVLKTFWEAGEMLDKSGSESEATISAEGIPSDIVDDVLQILRGPEAKGKVKRVTVDNKPLDPDTLDLG